MESPVVYNLDSGTNGSGGAGGMWGGDGSWIFAFLIIALIFGNRLGLGGNGNNDGGNGGGYNMPAFIPYPTASLGGFNAAGALTRADLCSEFNFNNLDSAVRGVANGICSLGYDQLAQINGVNSNIAAGFAGVNNAVCTLGYQNAQLINGLENTVQNGFNSSNIVALQNQNALQAQLAQCCCENREGQAQIRYDMATNTCALQNTIQNGFRDSVLATEAGTRAVIDKLCQMEYNNLNDKYQAALAENQGLKLDASQARQNTYLTNFIAAQTQQLRNDVAPTPVPSFPVNPPFPYMFGNWNNGNNCNSCCNG